MITGKRKNYSVFLDQEETENAQRQLEKAGMTLSGFIRSAIHEFLESLAVGQEKKSFKDMSASEFLEAVEEMKKKLTDKDEEKEKEIEQRLKDE